MIIKREYPMKVLSLIFKNLFLSSNIPVETKEELLTEEKILKKSLLDNFDLDYDFDDINPNFSTEWDEILRSWLEAKVPFTISSDSVRFNFPGGNSADVWTLSPFLKYGFCYKINDVETSFCLIPRLETMIRLEIAIQLQKKSALEDDFLKLRKFSDLFFSDSQKK